MSNYAELTGTLSGSSPLSAILTSGMSDSHMRSVIAQYLPTDTASGSIATFTDGAEDVPVADLTVAIEPYQDTSSGDPSPTNICPISGWTECNVYQYGTDSSDVTTYTTDLSSAGTVYGGTLDVTTGLLTVDRAYYSTTWGTMDYATTVGTTERRRYYVGSSTFSPSAGGVSNIAEYVSGGYSTDKGYRWYNDANSAFFYLPTDTDDTTEIEFVVYLATSTEYQLTATEVRTLLGANNIYADCGTVSVTYRADIGLYIDKVTS